MSNLQKDLKKIHIISKTTFKEIIKSKILLNTLFLGLLLLMITFVAYSFTYGAVDRVALDFGLGMLSLSSVGISIFIGVGLLSKEIESRTVYMIISRPVSRKVFIIGKLIGLSYVLVLNILILSSLTLSLYFIIGGTFSPLILWSILFIMLESILILFIIAFFSLVTTQTISVMLTLVLYAVGQSIKAAQSTGFAKSNPLVTQVLEIYHFILPAFYKLNIKEFVLHKSIMPLSYLGGTFAYGVMYSFFLLFMCIFVFERKNLD
ncbi:MAG: ABC-type transport system involved in multi-copper enzyme maturation permease subunit [Bacteriovoracaceae bacterium]|jgi:ABC-2 type transport system permease protein